MEHCHLQRLRCSRDIRKTRAACVSKSNEFQARSYASRAYWTANQPGLVGTLLFDLVSGGLSRQQSWRGVRVSFRFFCDLIVIPEPAHGVVILQRIMRHFQQEESDLGFHSVLGNDYRLCAALLKIEDLICWISLDEKGVSGFQRYDSCIN